MDIKLILHPTDGSPNAARALDVACGMARDYGARLLIVNAQRRHGLDVMPEELEAYRRVEHVRVTDAELRRAAAQATVDAAVETARGNGPTEVEGVVVEGDPGRVVADVAKDRGVDLIVMGSRGYTGIQELLLGSVTHKVLHAAPCNCLVVR